MHKCISELHISFMKNSMSFRMICKATQLFTNFQTDPFNCSDHCHLAWLIREKPNLLDVTTCHGEFKLPICSNGTSFSELNPNGFADCPVETPVKTNNE